MSAEEESSAVNLLDALRGGGKPLPDASPVINALCVDMDDLAEGIREMGYPLGHHGYFVERETINLLESLNTLGLKATFFIPGSVALGAKSAVMAVMAEGHEIASHGDRHFPAFKLSRAAFYDDVKRAKQRLEAMTGKQVNTFKAPIWSVTEGSPWAYEALLEAGYTVDHSAMPSFVKKLGYEAGRLSPFIYGEKLKVIPATSVKISGKAIPFCGGLYNAYVPSWIEKRVFGKINSTGVPFNYFFHPYEHSPEAGNKRLLKHRSLFVSAYAAHAGAYGRKLKYLAQHFKFAPLREVY